jgi:lysyl-tRNA synthetase class 2
VIGSSADHFDWQPTAPLTNLRQRARLLAAIRQFFAEREVWEVDTPLLSLHTATDPHLASFRVNTAGTHRYLQTSPEFAMKRLLAAGSGAIYQLGKAFRCEEQGHRHNPEFTLLEWYRPDWTLSELRTETVALIHSVAHALNVPTPTVASCHYRDLFLTHCGIDPHAISLNDLQACVNQLLPTSPRNPTADECLNLLMSLHIEPRLPSGLLFVSEFPASQAALAQIVSNAQGYPVALRSELYWNGIELANGYQELTDAVEQRRRFCTDLKTRTALGLTELPLPRALLAAIQHGLPACAGIALGVDRLLMCLLGNQDIAAVLPFTFTNA